MKGLTDIAGIRVGHATDLKAITGCTAILCDGGAIGGCYIGGAATGTSELATLDPGHVTDRVHAIVLSGGSAFGLASGDGVRRYLESKGEGFQTSAARVPIVVTAILYDLAIGRADVRPTRETGEAAAGAASDKAVEEGSVGAGTGATVGKVLGLSQAMKGGVGSYSTTLGGAHSGIVVAALAVTNSFGDVRDPGAGGAIVAGARKPGASAARIEFADSAAVLQAGPPSRTPFRENTTLAVVATNAQLTKVEASRLAQMAQAGMSRAISPVFTMYDGDIVFALSKGTAKGDINVLGAAAAEVLARAIVRSVRMAKTLGGIPGLAKS